MKASQATLALLTGLLLAPAPTPAQEPLTDPLLQHMIGAWVLEGTIAGQPTTHDVTVDWALARQYVQIHEVSREKDPAGAPAYEALVTIGWDKTRQQYACLWLDSTGGGGLLGDAIAHATPMATELPFVFRVAGTVFHTTFAYDPPTDTWRWLMDNEEDGKLQPFARVTLRRR